MDWTTIIATYGWIGAVIGVAALVSVLKEYTTAVRHPRQYITKTEILYYFLGACVAGVVVPLIGSLWIDSIVVLGGVAGCAAFIGPKGLSTVFDIGANLGKKKAGMNDRDSRNDNYERDRYRHYNDHDRSQSYDNANDANGSANGETPEFWEDTNAK